MAAPNSVTERKNGYFHSLSKVITNDTQYPFESKYKSSHTIKYEDVWVDEIPFCPTSIESDAFALNSNIVKKYELKELTEIPGSNGQAWYINDNKFVRPFISPVDIPNNITNMPSIGFEAKLYKSNGVQISPTTGVWFVDYYAGIVHFESGSTPNDLGWGIPKITVYVYIGNTLANLINKLETQQDSNKLITTGKILIQNNKIQLPGKSKGDIIFNMALVYIDLNSPYYIEYSASISIDGYYVNFDTDDSLDGKYAVVSYFGVNS